jgi:hypothetical protein
LAVIEVLYKLEMWSGVWFVTMVIDDGPVVCEGKGKDKGKDEGEGKGCERGVRGGDSYGNGVVSATTFDRYPSPRIHLGTSDGTQPEYCSLASITDLSVWVWVWISFGVRDGSQPRLVEDDPILGFVCFSRYCTFGVDDDIPKGLDARV